MYKIIAADGKEYGPFDINEMRRWKTEGRLGPQSLVLAPGRTDWRPAAEFPELGFGAAAPVAPVGLAGVPGAPGVSSPPPIAGTFPAGDEKGLATASLILGILSLACIGFLAGIPAIICGHIARGRARHQPERYGGGGLALAGLILGYVGTLVPLLILPAMLLPALTRAKAKAQEINCMNNMKQVGLAVRTWALDHDNQYPWNVSTNSGGTMELCLVNADGYDQNAVHHFRVMSNELSTPKILYCPGDTQKTPAFSFQSFGPGNLSYELRTGEEVSPNKSPVVLAICPIHHTVLMSDGSVQRSSRRSR